MKANFTAVALCLLALCAEGNAADINNPQTNATALTTGTVASARIVGSYTGITGVGSLIAGAIDNIVIGGSTPAAGSFTTLALTDNATQTKSVNGDLSFTMTNVNAGSSASASIYISNAVGSGFLSLAMLGTGATTGGGFVQDGGVIFTDSAASGGLSIMTLANAALRIYTNGNTNLRVAVGASGGLMVGASVTDQGAGTLNFQTAIYANGTIGVTRTCTIAVGNVLTFTLGILTGTSGVAGCT